MLFLKLWPSKADGSLMYQSCPLSKEKTRTHLHRGVSLRGVLPLLARVWAAPVPAVLCATQVHLYAAMKSTIFLKDVGISLDVLLTALSLAKSETLEKPLRPPKTTLWYHASLQRSLTLLNKREIIYCLLITPKKRKRLNTGRQTQKTNITDSEIKIFLNILSFYQSK